MSAVSAVRLKEAIYSPSLTKSKTVATVLLGIAVVSASNLLIEIQTSSTYKPSLLGAFYFLNNGGMLALLWGLPTQVVYYFSEIVVMNYMYVLAKEGWGWMRGPLTSGTIFLILGWALLHAITKDIFVVVDGVALVLMFYITYEYAEKSPIAPIILWFAQLVS